MPVTTASPPLHRLERAWVITESLHQLLTEDDPTDWPTVAALSAELRALAESAPPA